MVLYSKSYGLDQIHTVATDLVAMFKFPAVVVFEGDLGAGKTTLIKEICTELGVKERVSSPTFSLVNTYQMPTNNSSSGLLYHMDLYRLSGEAEAIDAGIDEILQGKNNCLVEWPERAPHLIPDDAYHVHILQCETDLRKIEVSQSKID